MNPPIRDESHQIEYKGVQNKVIDVIGSDHAPHTIDEKEYPNTPSGMTVCKPYCP